MAGRKRKVAHRYPSGQIVHAQRQPDETQAQTMATVISYRERQLGEKHKEHARRPEAGYELGRLYLTGMLTRRQHDAGVMVCMAYDAYHRMHGYPSAHPKAMDWSRVYSGLPFLSVENDPLARPHERLEAAEREAERVKRIANRYMGMSSAVADCGRQAVTLVRSLCVEDTVTRDWPDRAMRDLRRGLDSAGDFFGLPYETACEDQPTALLK